MEQFEKLCRGLIYGVAVGDAMGFPVQFYKREEVRALNISKMLSYRSGIIPCGTWSDDTSLTVALVDALYECEQSGDQQPGEKAGDPIDYHKIMRKFYLWISEGKFTPYHKAFDIGATCYKALLCYSGGEEPLRCGGIFEMDNGNGSLMRISPIVFYINKHFGALAFDENKTFEVIHNVSRLTHAHQIALIGCDIQIAFLFYLLNGEEKFSALKMALEKVRRFVSKNKEFEYGLSKYLRLYDDNFSSLPDTKISSRGYVVDTLEAALWCFLSTDSYRDCILKAINLGHDTDSVGAVAGAMAGLYYSRENGGNWLPKDWLDDLQGKDLLNTAVEKLSKTYVVTE